jgi:hypothetical protein
MAQQPHGIPQDDRIDAVGRMRLPPDYSAYFGSSSASLRSDKQHSIDDFLAGHDYRIVTMAQLMAEWNAESSN